MYTRDYIPKVLNMQQNVSNECRMMSSKSTARVYLYILLSMWLNLIVSHLESHKSRLNYLPGTSGC